MTPPKPKTTIPAATTPAVVDKENLSELPTGDENSAEITGDGSGTSLPPVDPVTPAAGTDIDPLPMASDGSGAVDGDKEYVAVYGGPMHDPESKVCFTGVPALAPMTKWLEIQIKAGKVKEQATEAPAK